MNYATLNYELRYLKTFKQRLHHALRGLKLEINEIKKIKIKK